MEPRPHERGNTGSGTARTRRARASMEPRPHERGNSKRALTPEEQEALQWSHVLTNVETPRREPEAASPVLLQWSHVLTNVETRQEREKEADAKRLQWSHVLTNVETTARTKPRHRPQGASMEPRPHERGNEQWRRTVEGDAGASMEPRPHERGNTSFPGGMRGGCYCFNGATSSRTWKLWQPSIRIVEGCGLQWSHVLTNVETRLTTKPCETTSSGFNGATSSRTWKLKGASVEEITAGMLQWSHVLTNVETPSGFPSNRLPSYCFNGATSSRTWKPRQRGRHRPRQGASMEPRPHERGNVVAAVFDRDAALASMEPRPHERGNAG